MRYIATEDTPITIYLPDAANDTGWSEDGITATHDSCNAGSITLTGYSLVSGRSYQISYIVPTISSGYVQAFAGSIGGIQRTAANVYVETLVSDGIVLTFFSNGNCTLQAFNIKDVTDANAIGTTIVYSAVNRKWSDFRTFYPDFGLFLFTRTLTMHNGDLYNHDNGTNNRNNFYGTQFSSNVKFVENATPESIKTFLSLNYQANSLLVTVANGISTSLGQFSQLEAWNFLKDVLQDGATTVNVYAVQGVYSASLLRQNDDLNNGNQLKGNYLIVELTTVDGSIPLQLYSAEVNASISKIGVR